MAAECYSEVEKVSEKLLFPLGNKPLAVVSTLYDSPHYRELLLSGQARECSNPGSSAYKCIKNFADAGKSSAEGRKRPHE